MCKPLPSSDHPPARSSVYLQNRAKETVTVSTEHYSTVSQWKPFGAMVIKKINNMLFNCIPPPRQPTVQSDPKLIKLSHFTTLISNAVKAVQTQNTLLREQSKNVCVWEREYQCVFVCVWHGCVVFSVHRAYRATSPPQWPLAALTTAIHLYRPLSRLPQPILKFPQDV